MNDWRKCIDLTDRLNWAKNHSKVTHAELAKACGISRAAVSTWFSGETRNIRLDNFFSAASFMAINPKWLAIGEETPFAASRPKDIAGPYLEIAKDLTKLNDRKLKTTILELIKAKKLAKNL